MTKYMIQVIPMYQKEWRFLDTVSTDYKSESENISDLLMELAEVIKYDEMANVKNRYRIIDSVGNIIMKFDGRKLADKEICNDDEVELTISKPNWQTNGAGNRPNI